VVDFIRLVLTEQGHAAVTFFFGIVVKTMVVLRMKNIGGQLVQLRFRFLDTHHIGVLLLHPSEKALAFRRTDAVGI